jgi:hypothetical protein
MSTPASHVGLLTQNTGAQNSAAWDALMAGLPATTGAHIEFGNGTYSFARALDIIRPMRLTGIAGAHGTSTRFLFPIDSHGFEFHSYYSYALASSSNRSDGAIVENIRVSADGKGKIRHGARVRSPSELHNCYFEGWSGDGIHVLAGLFGGIPSSASLTRMYNNSIVNGGKTVTVTSLTRASNVTTVVTATAHGYEAGTTNGNDTIFWLNNITLPYCVPLVNGTAPAVDTFILGCKGGIIDILSPTSFRFADPGADAVSVNANWQVRTGNGLYVHGGDANGITFQGFSVVNCKCWAIYEDSQLGNTHIAHHCDSCELGSFYMDQANNYSAWTGCYAEQNCPCDYINKPNTVAGGAPGPTQLGNAQRFGPGTIENCDALVRNLGIGNDGIVGWTGLGHSQDGNPSFLHFRPNGNANKLSWFYNRYTSYFTGYAGNIWSMDYNYGGDTAFMVAHNGVTGPNSRTVTPGSFILPRGYLTANGCLHDDGTAPPIAGDGPRKRGDVRWNSAQTVGQPTYWVCTADGTPGTWVAGPNL